MKNSKILLLLVSFIIICVCFEVLLYDGRGGYHEGLEKLEEPKKYILYWTKMFGQNDFYLGLGSDIFAHCPIRNCFTTNNKSLMPVEEFDAILFHGPEYTFRKFDKPSNRSPDQIYIFSNQESPEHTPDLHAFHNFYNWTMTYRLDSDVVRPYGRIFESNTDYELPTVENIAKKTKIAWLVSNCRTPSAREFLYQKLAKHFEIDVIGLCGNYTCSKLNADDCYSFLETNYKFYLSFENSFCTGYVTEKLYNVLQRNLIPVVYGGADYNGIVPPKSVIDVTKFESIKALVDFIKTLDGNVGEYLEYFKWKQKYVVDTSNKVTLCSLCEKLNQPVVRKVYGDMDKWWNGDKDLNCKHGADLPGIVVNSD